MYTCTHRVVYFNASWPRVCVLAPVSGTLADIPQESDTTGRVCEFIKINVCRELIQGAAKRLAVFFVLEKGLGTAETVETME